MNTKRARLMLLGLAVSWFAMAYGFAGTVAEEALYPQLWPWLFGVGGISMVVLAATLHRGPLVTSFVVVMFGLLGRVAASIERWRQGVIEFDRIFVSGGAFATIAIMASMLWVLVLGPVVSYHRQTR